MWHGSLYLEPLLLAIAGGFIAALGLTMVAGSRREVKDGMDE